MQLIWSKFKVSGIEKNVQQVLDHKHKNINRCATTIRERERERESEVGKEHVQRKYAGKGLLLLLLARVTDLRAISTAPRPIQLS